MQCFIDDLSLNLIVTRGADVGKDAFKLITRKIKEPADPVVTYVPEVALRNSATVADLKAEVVRRGLTESPDDVRLYCQDGQR